MSRHIDEHGAFELTTLPGQPQVAICHSFFITEEHRGRGKGKALKEAQRVTLRRLHYDYGVCTVSANNAAQKRILMAAGWQKLTEFHNRRLCETTELWGVQP